MFSMTCAVFINGVRRSGLGWGCEKTGFSYFWLVWAVTVSGLSANINKPTVSDANGLAAHKPSSQVAISCSGCVSISGFIWASGATLIPRPSRACDLMTMAEVDSGRVPSLGRVTMGIGSVSRGAETKLNSLGTFSRPSWLRIDIVIHNSSIEYLGFYVRNRAYRNILVPIYFYGEYNFYHNATCTLPTS